MRILSLTLLMLTASPVALADGPSVAAGSGVAYAGANAVLEVQGAQRSVGVNPDLGFKLDGVDLHKNISADITLKFGIPLGGVGAPLPKEFLFLRAMFGWSRSEGGCDINLAGGTQVNAALGGSDQDQLNATLDIVRVEPGILCPGKKQVLVFAPVAAYTTAFAAGQSGGRGSVRGGSSIRFFSENLNLTGEMLYGKETSADQAQTIQGRAEASFPVSRKFLGDHVLVIGVHAQASRREAPARDLQTATSQTDMGGGATAGVGF